MINIENNEQKCMIQEPSITEIRRQKRQLIEVGAAINDLLPEPSHEDWSCWIAAGRQAEERLTSLANATPLCG